MLRSAPGRGLVIDAGRAMGDIQGWFAGVVLQRISLVFDMF